jgi:hypothetical protein
MKAYVVRYSNVVVARALPRPLFSSPNSPPNFTMQKEDSLSHQNAGKCMEY